MEKTLKKLPRINWFRPIVLVSRNEKVPAEFLKISVLLGKRVVATSSQLFVCGDSGVIIKGRLWIENSNEKEET